MVRSKKDKPAQAGASVDAGEPRADSMGLLTAPEAAVLRFLMMGYVGLLASDKQALLGLEAKGFAQHIMGGWLLTTQGKAYAQQIEAELKKGSGKSPR
jgi:hypothetical protein